MEQGKSKVGFLSLYFDLYLGRGDAGLRTQEVYAKQLVECLEQSNEVVFPGVCTNRTQVDEAVRVFDREEVDVIVVVFLCYVPSSISCPLWKRTPRPVVIWNTQKLWAVTQNSSLTTLPKTTACTACRTWPTSSRLAALPHRHRFLEGRGCGGRGAGRATRARCARCASPRPGGPCHGEQGDLASTSRRSWPRSVCMHHLPMRVVADERLPPSGRDRCADGL